MPKRVDAVRNGQAVSTAYVEAIAESIPLPDASFDRVFCLFSFGISKTSVRRRKFPRAQTKNARL